MQNAGTGNGEAGIGEGLGEAAQRAAAATLIHSIDGAVALARRLRETGTVRRGPGLGIADFGIESRRPRESGSSVAAARNRQGAAARRGNRGRSGGSRTPGNTGPADSAARSAPARPHMPAPGFGHGAGRGQEVILTFFLVLFWSVIGRLVRFKTGGCRLHFLSVGVRYQV